MSPYRFLALCVLIASHVVCCLGAGPAPLYSGYLPLENKQGSSLYYAYWEAGNTTAPTRSAKPIDTNLPILLWLQGGPGCASSFGAFYELGPYVTDDNGKLKPNPFAWNKNFGLLIIDQPIGTGYSIAGSESDIPQDMQGMAEDLYSGLWQFFDQHKELQHRPFFITGESYAGKYIPSIAHYILQVENGDVQHSRHCRRRRSQHARQTQSSDTAGRLSVTSSNSNAWQRLQAVWTYVLGGKQPLQQEILPLQHRQQQQQQGRDASCWVPRQTRPLNLSSVPLPNFDLVGVAIGNGLTDPLPQTRALASVAYNMGLVSEAVQAEISQRTEEIVQLVSQGSWEQVTSARSQLLEYIQQEAGVATLLDVRRTQAYDAAKAVDALLDSPAARQWMRAAPQAPSYHSCSEVIERVMAADVMRSCLKLVEDLLDVMPVLLYQGQFDVQDGVAGSSAWIKRLDWSYIDDFEEQEGELWYAEPGVAAGWKRRVSTLTQVMVRNAGHMVPRDQARAAQAMIQQWVADVLEGEGWGKAPWPTGIWQHGGGDDDSAQSSGQQLEVLRR